MAVYRNVNVLLGKTLTQIKKESDKQIILYTSDDKVYKMLHFQDCCESVYVEDIIGDLDDLLNSPITMAEEVTERGTDDDDFSTHTWTFYKFATNKGYVTIRWNGSSNGYYSESVDFIEVANDTECPSVFDVDDENDLGDDDIEDEFSDLRDDNGFINISLSNKADSDND